MDIIFLYGISAKTLIGWYDHERTALKEIKIDLQIGLPQSTSTHIDELSNTIDYDDVVNTLRTSLMVQHFRLLETLSEYIATRILDHFKAPWVKVSVTKPNAIKDVQQVGVEIERRRQVSLQT